DKLKVFNFFAFKYHDRVLGSNPVGTLKFGSLVMIFTSIIITISSILTYFQMHGTNEYLDRTIKDTISETLDSLEDKINLSIESK
ncbi:hypothetical protein B2J68_04230, partial [Vibrio cholerae]